MCHCVQPKEKIQMSREYCWFLLENVTHHRCTKWSLNSYQNWIYLKQNSKPTSFENTGKKTQFQKYTGTFFWTTTLRWKTYPSYHWIHVILLLFTWDNSTFGDQTLQQEIIADTETFITFMTDYSPNSLWHKDGVMQLKVSNISIHNWWRTQMCK